jgi:hypothetical protein
MTTPTSNVIPLQISAGMRGTAVEKIQTVLTSKGFAVGEINGLFGPETEQAVKDFQAKAGLPVTGIVDTATAQAILSQATLSRAEGPLDMQQRAAEALRVAAAAASASAPAAPAAQAMTTAPQAATAAPAKKPMFGKLEIILLASGVLAVAAAFFFSRSGKPSFESLEDFGGIDDAIEEEEEEEKKEVAPAASPEPSAEPAPDEEPSLKEPPTRRRARKQPRLVEGRVGKTTSKRKRAPKRI